MESIVDKIENLIVIHDRLSPELIKEKNIKLGLRNADGTGIVAGITTKGRVVGYEKKLNKETNETQILPADGKLFYCNYDVKKLVDEYETENRFGFEEVVYLLLTGELPKEEDLEKFNENISGRAALSILERRIFMSEVENENQMYGLHSVVSHLSRCDVNPDSNDIKDVFRQCLNLIAKFPTIIANNYNVQVYRNGGDLKILSPLPELSISENFLYMLKGEKPDKYEAQLFDIALILHAEHGGGNNSTFTVRSVTSSGANTYMAIAAGIASLSGHLHGGANESVVLMMEELKEEVEDWTDEVAIEKFLYEVLDKKKGDGSGKLFGFGHAVYTKSDPRAIIFKRHIKKFSKQKGAYDEFKLYTRVEEIAVKIMSKKKNIVLSANVDFYSGFVYRLMGIPRELFTPVFAMARVSGWAAHRLEQIIQGKIMRPAYIASCDIENEYLALYDREDR